MYSSATPYFRRYFRNSFTRSSRELRFCGEKDEGAGRGRSLSKLLLKWCVWSSWIISLRSQSPAFLKFYFRAAAFESTRSLALYSPLDYCFQNTLSMSIRCLSRQKHWHFRLSIQRWANANACTREHFPPGVSKKLWKAGAWEKIQLRRENIVSALCNVDRETEYSFVILYELWERAFWGFLYCGNISCSEQFLTRNTGGGVDSSTKLGYVIVPRFSEFCSCCCLSLQLLFRVKLT